MHLSIERKKNKKKEKAHLEMAGYNSEYTLITKNFVFLDAKKATIAQTGITWGPYKLQVAKAKEPAADKPKKVPVPKEQKSREDAANELIEIAAFIADTKNKDQKVLTSKKGTFTKKYKLAKTIQGFDDEYEVDIARSSINKKPVLDADAALGICSAGFGQSSSSFGAGTTYNFACWFYTGGEVKDDAVGGIKKLANEEIGAAIELHATTTTLTRADTSRCFHKNLVGPGSGFGGPTTYPTPFDGADNDPPQRALTAAEIASSSALSAISKDDDDDEDQEGDEDGSSVSSDDDKYDSEVDAEAEAAQKKAEAEAAKKKAAEEAAQKKPEDDDDDDDADTSLVKGPDPDPAFLKSAANPQPERPAAAKTADPDAGAETVPKKAGPAKAKNGGARKAAGTGPKAAAEPAIIVYVNFAAFSSSANKCMIAYMQGTSDIQDQQAGQQAQPQTYVFYTVLAAASAVEVGSNSDIANGAVDTATASLSASKAHGQLASPRLPQTLPGIGAFGLYKHFRDANLDFYRRVYVPNVLCDIRVTDSMEYLFSRICTTEIKYYNAVSIIQALMMGTIAYKNEQPDDLDGAIWVSLNTYTEKQPAKVIVQVNKDKDPANGGVQAEVSVFGSRKIDDLLTALSEIARTELITVDDQKSKTIAERIYEIARGEYRIELTSISVAVLNIARSASTEMYIQVREGANDVIKTVEAKPVYMYARVFNDTGNEVLVYMTKEQGSADVGRFVVAFSSHSESVTQTDSGLILTIKAGKKFQLGLPVDDVKRSLHLTQKNTVVNEKLSKFKTNGIKWTTVQDVPQDIPTMMDIERATNITKEASVLALPPPPGGEKSSGFGRSRSRGMSRFV